MNQPNIEPLFESIGTVQYFKNPLKAWLLIDPEIGRFYRSLIPKSYGVAGQRYPSHISFVRKLTPPLMQHWDKYEGEVVPFTYSSYLHNDQTYWWLDVQCERLEQIRLELGMPIYGPTTLSPNGKHKFHSTVANMKPVA